MGPLDLLPEADGPLGAFVELHNLIAAAETAADFGPADRDRIARERGVDLRTAFRDERVGVYARLFDGARGAFTPEAIRTLGAVARTLALSPADVCTLHAHAFGEAVEAALADDCLTVEERLHLHALQQTLGLDDATGAALVDGRARQHLFKAVARALCDGRLSPDEAAEVARATEALGVAIPAEIAAMLAAAAERWEREAAPMPDIGTDLRLVDGETVYALVAAAWTHKRADALEHAFAGGVSESATERLAFPWSRFMVPLTSGRVALTSARLLLLDDDRQTTRIALTDIVQALAFADALIVRVHNDSRRVVLRLGAETPRFAELLGRALGRRPAGHAARWQKVSGADADRWSLPGRVAVSGRRVSLQNVVGEHHIDLTRVGPALRDGRQVAIGGWLLLFDEAPDARSFLGATLVR